MACMRVQLVDRCVGKKGLVCSSAQYIQYIEAGRFAVRTTEDRTWKQNAAPLCADAAVGLSPLPPF